MLGPEEAEVARRRRNRRRMALGAVAVAGLGAGVTILVLRKGGGLSWSRNPLEYQHFVRGHERKLPSGGVTTVRPYLRGPRDAAIKTTAFIQPEQQLHSITHSEGV